MPIYEYACLDCLHQFETRRAMQDADAPLVCGKCGSEHVKRKLTLVYVMSSVQAASGKSQGSGCGSCSGGNCAGCVH